MFPLLLCYKLECKKRIGWKLFHEFFIMYYILCNYDVDFARSPGLWFLCPNSNAPENIESGDIPLLPSFCSLILIIPPSFLDIIVEIDEDSAVTNLLVATSSILRFLRRFGGTMESRNKFRREFNCFKDSGLVSL